MATGASASQPGETDPIKPLAGNKIRLGCLERHSRMLIIGRRWPAMIHRSHSHSRSFATCNVLACVRVPHISNG